MMFPCVRKRLIRLAMPLYGIGTQYKNEESSHRLEAAEQTKRSIYRLFPYGGSYGAGFNANKGLLEMELAPGMGMSMLKMELWAALRLHSLCLRADRL
jgi:hypothetical protein